MMSDKITETPREERIPPLPPPAMCLVATSSWEALYVARGDAAYDSALIDVRGAHSALKDTAAHWQAKHAALLADAERLRAALRFIHDECDWETLPDGHRIGVAAFNALHPGPPPPALRQATGEEGA